MAAFLVPFTDGMKFGLGYNRLTGDVLPTPAVQGSSITSVQGAGGQTVTSKCTTITEVETLHKSLGLSIDVGGSYMGFSASAKVNYANSCDFSSFSTYIVVQVSVQDAIETIDSPVFSPDANEILVNNNPLRFRQRFGDTFISGVKKGGEFFAIYQITSSDLKEKEDVAVKVKAAYSAPLGTAGVSLNVEIQKATASSKSHLEVSCYVFRQGTISTTDLNFDDVMKTAKEFPLNVSGDKAFPYAVLLQSYEGLKNPNDQFLYIEIQNQQDVLEDLAKKRFEFLALRDDIKYMLKNSEDFQNADGTPIDRDKLRKNLDEVVDTINTMQKAASVCTRDAQKCEFTKFDATKFDLPHLKKSSDVLVQPLKVFVPNFVGLTLDAASLLAGQNNILLEDRIEARDLPLLPPDLIISLAVDIRSLSEGWIDQDGIVIYHPHPANEIIIIWQDTAPGSPVKPGSLVTILLNLASGILR